MSAIPPDARRIAPGVYDTPNGELHIDLEELVTHLGGNPNSIADLQTAQQAVAHVFGAENIPIDIRLK